MPDFLQNGLKELIFFIGGGLITFGVMKTKLQNLETTCRNHRSLCPSSLGSRIQSLEDKVDRIAEDVAFIRGKLSQRVKEHQDADD